MHDTCCKRSHYNPTGEKNSPLILMSSPRHITRDRAKIVGSAKLDDGGGSTTVDRRLARATLGSVPRPHHALSPPWPYDHERNDI